MVVINLGYTAPINRPGESPTLTLAQVWQGLKRKVRHAEEFVPVIVHCEVLDEKTSETGEEVVTRTVKFAAGSGPKGGGEPVKEVCYHYAPCRVDFQQEDGSRISNFVSSGPSGEKEDLLMTYVFEWRYPDLEAGSEKAKELEDLHNKVSFPYLRRVFIYCRSMANMSLRLQKWPLSPASRLSGDWLRKARLHDQAISNNGSAPVATLVHNDSLQHLHLSWLL